jgi:two-component system chemotaxis sensor kinase CheA
MELALEGLLKACETMFMLTLEPRGDFVAFDPTSMKFGGRISVIRDDGVWDLALFGCENGCKSLTRAIYVMEPDEEPTAEEVVDALGELVNMTAGAIKKAVGSGDKSTGTIPLFLEGDECAKFGTRKIPLLGRALSSPDMDGEIFFVWSERTSKALMSEISAVLEEAGGDEEASPAEPEQVLGPVERDEEDLELFVEFLDESYDEVDRIEEILGEIQGGASDPDYVNEMFRKVHSIKGVASCIDLEDITRLTHITEEVLSDCREDKLKVAGNVLDVVLESNDLLRILLDAVKVAVDESREVRRFSEVEPLVAKLEAVRDGQVAPSAAISGGSPDVVESGADAAAAGSQERTKVERDEEDVELLVEFLDESYDEVARIEEVLLELQQGVTDPEHLNEVFRKVHSIKGVASCCDLDDITNLTHITEEVLSDCRSEKYELKGGVIDVCMDSNDLLRKLLDEVKYAVDEGTSLILFPEVAGLIDRLEAVRRGEMLATPEPQGLNLWLLAEALSLLEELGESLPQWADGSLREGVTKCHEVMQLVINGDVDEPEPFVAWAVATVDGLLSALENGKAFTSIELPAIKDDAQPEEAEAPQRSAKKTKETVKVDMELLNQLEALCLKLNEAQKSMTETDTELSGPLLQAFQEMSGVSTDIHEISARLRMVELKPVFTKMSRMVRDLAKKTEKLVKLVVHGDDTKVDRKMAEAVSSPLVHMVRNAVDHGLESPEGRKGVGKPPLGTITINAYNDEKEVIVEISDDGKGIDKDVIFTKAVQKGLVEENQDMPESEILALIFHPGFSTAAQVTSISGRGVGMDVVRRDIESLGGRIEIATNLGKGSTFKMVMPLIAAN